MDKDVLIALCTAIPPTVAALAGVVISVLNRGKIAEIHTATDGMKDQLVRATRSDAFQKGVTEGTAQEQANPTQKANP